jgi:hypothetical protein
MGLHAGLCAGLRMVEQSLWFKEQALHMQAK